MERPITRPANAPHYVHVMAKPTGAICNLDCEYCFFLSKEALYPGSPFRMKNDVLEAYIRQLIETQGGPMVTIAWQGGEPTLMGLEFFEYGMGLVQKYARPGMQIDHTIQTNGTKIDDAWCKFFKQHNFLVGLSMDGPKEIHDTYRVDKSGDGTFDQVLAAARALQQYNVDFNILCTVHAGNAGRPLEVYRYFRDEVKAEFMQFIPIVERATPELLPVANQGWGDHNLPSPAELEDLPIAKSSKRPLYTLDGSLVTDRSVTAQAWGGFLIAIYDEWVRNDVGKVFVQTFDSALGSWYGTGASLCIHRETCGMALALEHTGDLYSCDHFVEPRFLLGNIKEEHMLSMVSSEQQVKFGNDKRDTLPQYCLDCEVRFACHGGCPRNRFIRTPDGEDGLNYLCSGYRAFFNHIDYPMKLMAALLKQGRYADEVMPILAREETGSSDEASPAAPEPMKKRRRRKKQ
ncbi:MAG: anaerobic sulfatase maturase [Anaerolineales bacterium]|nr:anaerobic sulfatase maturase [Anaerolineales bacterium]